MKVAPGDFVIGDEEGLLRVPFDEVDDICRIAYAKHESEESPFADMDKAATTAQRIKRQGQEEKR